MQIVFFDNKEVGDRNVVLLCKLATVMKLYKRSYEVTSEIVTDDSDETSEPDTNDGMSIEESNSMYAVKRNILLIQYLIIIF